MKKVILVTGASSGLGLATANALHAEGHIVYGGSRTVKSVKNASFIPLELDVTDDQSVNAAIELIIKAEGKIDVLVNNAGIVMAGPLYTMSVEDAKKQFEVNFFGVVRVSTAVVPGMIAKKSGLVINISSIAGLFGTPYVGTYVAAKFALEGYSQSLRMELQNTGVQVTVVNPGDFTTKNTSGRVKLPFILDNNEQLKNEYAATIEKIEKDETNGGDPATVGALIAKIVAKSKPAHRYKVGAFGQTVVPFVVKAILPTAMFSKSINGYYNIK